MQSKTDTFNYLVELRKSVVAVISGVQNSTSSPYWWDTTTPNSSIRAQLKDVFHNATVTAGRKWGLLIVTKHWSCPSPMHQGYPTSCMFDIDVPFEEYEEWRSGYFWTGERLYDGDRYLPCPCSPKKEFTTHYVTDEIVFAEKGTPETCARLTPILLDVNEALNRTGCSTMCWPCRQCEAHWQTRVRTRSAEPRRSSPII